jgi:hypothetical protein
VNGSKHLVLGACTALPMRRLQPFVASLRGTGFAGDVCLLVRDVAADTVQQLRADGVMVERSAPSAQPRMAANASRCFSYLDFLLRHGERYANVLLIDPSDMVFQADPFATPLAADIVSIPRPATASARRPPCTTRWCGRTAKPSPTICAIAPSRMPTPPSPRVPGCCAISPR